MMYQDRDYELLSAYLDGALEADERAALEARLETDAALRHELAALRQTVALIRALPTLKAPRSFTLTAAQAEQIRLQDAPSTFTADSQDSDVPNAAMPDNIMTLPTSRPMGRGISRRPSRQPFWVGAAAAVVLGMVCVATLLLALPSLNRMPVSSFQSEGNAVSGVSTATAFDTAEGEQESQQAAETLSDGSTTTESAGDDGRTGQDNRPGGTGGAVLPLEPSTTANKVADPSMTAQTFDLASTSAAAPALTGTLSVPRAMNETEILNTQAVDSFAYSQTEARVLTLTTEDILERDGVTTVSPNTASPLPVSPSPQPSMTIVGYMTVPVQPAGTMADALRMDETAPPTSEITADDVTDEEAASGAGTTDTDTPADTALSAVIAATEPVANTQQSVPPTLGEAGTDAEMFGMLASPPAFSFSLTELLLWLLLQIILRVF